MTIYDSCCWNLSFASLITRVVYSVGSSGPWFLFLCRADLILGLCGLPQAWGALWRGHLRCRRLHGHLRSLHLAGCGVLWRHVPGPHRPHPGRPPVCGRCLDTRTRHFYRPARGRAIEACMLNMLNMLNYLAPADGCWWMWMVTTMGWTCWMLWGLLRMNAFFYAMCVCVWI